MRPISRRQIQRVIFGIAFSLLTAAGTAIGQTLNWTPAVVGSTTMNAVAYSPERGERLAVGTGGAVILSRDAVTWTTASSGTTTLNGVAWGSGQYVAVGVGGVIRTSPDGVTWTTRTSGTANDLMAVAWISTSTSGTGQWIAVGLAGTILTSPTGASWTTRVSGVESTIPATGLRAISWANPANTLTAIVVGDQGKILTSTDGITWGSRTSGTTNTLSGVVWMGTRATVVGSGNTVLTSTNSTSWTTRNIGGGGGGSGFVGVAWAPGTSSSRLLIGGSATNNSMLTSIDSGVNWTTINLTNASYKHAVWDGSHFIVLGTLGRLVASHDGVLPGTPTLKTPVDSAVGVFQTPTLAWSGVAGVRTYHAQIGLNTGFTTTQFNDTAVTDTTCTASTLSDNATYYWRVRAKNVAGYGSWMPARTFKTAMIPPPQGVLSTPANKAAGVLVFPDFSWAALGNAFTYAIQLSTDSLFTAPLWNESTLTATSTSLGPLAFNTTYYWRVRGANTGGSGSWSAIRSFTTETAPTGVPAAPTLTSPAIFATGVPASPTFSWTRPAGTVSYSIQVSTTANFSTIVTQDSTLSKPTYTTSPLSGSTEYYWRVRAKNSFGSGAWSEVSSFTTILTAPEIPQQSSPAAFATEIASPVNLTWATVKGATTYHAQLSLNPEFSSFVVKDSTITAFSKSSGTLTGSTFYYWRVRAKNSAGVSDWSSTRRFTTAEVQIVGVTGLPVSSQRLTLSAGKLNFNLASRERVIIRLFDLRGGNTLELMNEVSDPGSHEIRIPSTNHGDLRILEFRSDHYHQTMTILP